MPRTTTHERMRDLLDGADFHGLFLGLGWDNPPDTGPVRIEVDDTELVARRVADKKGVAVWTVICDAPPHGLEKRRVSLGLRKYSPLGRLVILDTPEKVLFLWPELTTSGRERIVEHEYRKGHGGGDAVLQRLERIRFTIDEQATLTPLAVRDRVRHSFNVEKVTNRFYEEFQTHHAYLTENIEGIKRDEDRRWYASVLLNRLMFIYFIQRKRFMNDDPNYLSNRLESIRELVGPDQPHIFFREFLLPLFHQGLGDPDPTYDNSTIGDYIGKLPYINGGIFEIHQLEYDYDIYINDKAFARIFEFFDNYRWHLDESPTGADNEINPDILGFIFERYINLREKQHTTQKEAGAYYTKPDVTGYMATSTIIPAIVDRLVAVGLDDPCILIPGSDTDYIHSSLGYGTDKPLPSEDLPSLDFPEEGLNLALPGERWCDVLYRRQQYDKLIKVLSDNERKWTIDDAVTYNLDLQTLMVDYLSLLSTSKECQTAFDVLKSLTVCDPTAGSGAFLLAALDVLDPLYTTVIEAAEYLQSTEKGTVPFLTDTSSHSSERYWMLRTVCLNNLYGMDIMAEAVDIAKLRLFLKLAAQLDTISQVEPLPDLDFNIRAGNLLVGLVDLVDANRRFEKNRLPIADLDTAIAAAELAATAYKEFVASQVSDQKVDYLVAKQHLETKINAATGLADSALHQMRNENDSLEDWRKTHQPFHWFTQFPAVWSEDGFDVIIGNPPYIKTRGKHKFDYTWRGYNTQECPDLYAVCTERASTLLNNRGRFAMIVMHSACVGGKYAELRTHLSNEFEFLWVSAFSCRPTGLFSPSAAVRNSIIIGSQVSVKPGRAITGLQRWARKARQILFDRIAYTNSVKIMDQALNTWALPGDHLVAEGLEMLYSKGRTFSNSQVKRESPLWFKATALYMLSSYIEEPPAFDKERNPAPQTRGEWMHFRSDGERDIAFLIMAGRWMFLWWLALGDDFDVTKKVLGSFPADLEYLSQNGKLLELAQNLCDEAPDHLFWVRKAGRKVGNYDLRKCRHITDEADWLLARAWGFTREQYDAAGNLRDRMTFKPRN